MTDDDDRVFKALADRTRRRLLDRLFARDGRTLSDLESEEDMSRFGVMKHLKQLEDAGLVTTRKSGREKLHFLNVVPIRLIHDRWIDKYTEPQVAALTQLKAQLEKPATAQVCRVCIKAAPDVVWNAITDPEWSVRYGFRGPVSYDLRPGGEFKVPIPGMELVEGEVVEVDPPRRLVQTWRPTWLDEPATRLTYEIKDDQNGVCSLSVTQVGGGAESVGAGWAEILSDLKTLLETGSSLY